MIKTKFQEFQEIFTQAYDSLPVFSFLFINAVIKTFISSLLDILLWKWNRTVLWSDPDSSKNLEIWRKYRFWYFLLKRSVHHELHHSKILEPFSLQTVSYSCFLIHLNCLFWRMITYLRQWFCCCCRYLWHFIFLDGINKIWSWLFSLCT